MPPADTRAILPQPPEELKQRSAQLAGKICERIDRDGPIPFAAFMEMALYQPGLGYYSAGLHKFGADGDFVTAPGLGKLFAGCLARQAGQLGAELGDWELLEVGAGEGRLAAALLAALGEDAAPRCYLILERSADLRAVQRKHLQAGAPWMLQRVRWLDAPPTEAWQGLLLANEVIDALPVERFQVGEGLEQLLVGHDGGAFSWEARPAPPALDAHLRATLGALADDLPRGYRSECLPMLGSWLEGLTAGLRRGVALFIDYGYPRRAYYSTERNDGTLMCHFRHRAHPDPLLWPGLQDITAWVDFTALAEAGQATGLELAGYCAQGAFLLACGLPDFAAGLETLPAQQRLAMAREIRTLTLPGEMGERFQCMALARDWPAPLLGFSGQDLRGRL